MVNVTALLLVQRLIHGDLRVLGVRFEFLQLRLLLLLDYFAVIAREYALVRDHGLQKFWVFEGLIFGLVGFRVGYRVPR